MKSLIFSFTLPLLFLASLSTTHQRSETTGNLPIRNSIADDCKKKTIYYYKSGDDQYRICVDEYGKVVTRPDGSKDSFGAGYLLEEVADSYKLGKYYEKKKGKDCICAKE